MPKTTNLLLTAAACVMLGACGDESASDMSPPPERLTPGFNELVFESRQSVQCGSRGLTTQQSAQKLVNGGIDVLESNCGVNTNLVFVTVCGAGTGDILIHKIRKVNLPDAERLGFSSVATLQNPTTGIGYVKVDCDTGAQLPEG